MSSKGRHECLATLLGELIGMAVVHCMRGHQADTAVTMLLGHASIQTTQRYQHLESSDVSPEAVAILNRQNVERNRAKIRAV